MTKDLLTPVIAIAMLFTASGCNGGDDGSMGTGGMASGGGLHCQELCDVSGTLSCPGDNASTCVTDCEELLNALPSCSAQTQALHDCAYQEPASSWECDADTGESHLKAEYCGAELTTLENCVAAAISGK